MRIDLRLRGCADIRYAPSSTSVSRFPFAYDAHSEHETAIALVGNRVRSRVPGKTMPGAKWRADVVRVFEREFGHEFAVYGDGWNGPSARGPIPFDDQRRAYSSSRIALGVDHLRYAHFFSNRLPNAMACGVPIAHGRNPGFDNLFPGWMQGQFFESTAEAVGVARHLISMSNEELMTIAHQQRAEVESRFNRISAVLHDIVLCAQAKRLRKAPPVNPWVGQTDSVTTEVRGPKRSIDYSASQCGSGLWVQ